MAHGTFSWAPWEGPSPGPGHREGSHRPPAPGPCGAAWHRAAGGRGASRHRDPAPPTTGWPQGTVGQTRGDNRWEQLPEAWLNVAQTSPALAIGGGVLFTHLVLSRAPPGTAERSGVVSSCPCPEGATSPGPGLRLLERGVSQPRSGRCSPLPGAAFVRPSALGEACAHVAHASVTRPSVRHLSITYWSIYRLCLSTNHLSPVIYCLLTNHLLAAGRFKPRVGRFVNAARADLYTRLGCRALCPGLPAAGFLEDTVGCEREEVSPFLPQLLSGSPQSQRGPLLQPWLLRAPQTPRVPPGPRSAAPCARRPGSWSRWSQPGAGALLSHPQRWAPVCELICPKRPVRSHLSDQAAADMASPGSPAGKRLASRGEGASVSSLGSPEPEPWAGGARSVRGATKSCLGETSCRAAEARAHTRDLGSHPGSQKRKRGDDDIRSRRKRGT